MYGIGKKIRCDRLNCKVSSDLVSNIKEVYVINENTEEVKVFKEAKGGWIPVLERLPEEYTVLCCDKYGEMLIGHLHFDEVSNTNYSCEADNEIMYNCIAWQPLPEPYKESDTVES